MERKVINMGQRKELSELMREIQVGAIIENYNGMENDMLVTERNGSEVETLMRGKDVIIVSHFNLDNYEMYVEGTWPGGGSCVSPKDREYEALDAQLTEAGR